MARLRSDFWVSAHLRRCALEGVDAVLRRRGSAEAGAIFVSLDQLDGRCALYGPAPQSVMTAEDGDRRFILTLTDCTALDIEARMQREISFDPDLWWLSVDDRHGRTLLDVMAPGA